MRILIVTPVYPSETNKHGYGFVHARAKMYAKRGNKLMIFVPSKQENLVYTYEGIRVVRKSLAYFNNTIDDFNPNIIVIHSPNGLWFSSFSKIGVPIILYIHGAEALLTAFHHYYFPFSFQDNLKKALSLIRDSFRCILLRKFLQTATTVIYPSKWMKTTAEQYTLMKHPSSFIVPNPVDVDLFKPMNINLPLRSTKALSVRALGWKYGLDVAIKAFSNLQNTHLTIVGQGPLEKFLRKLALQYRSNVVFMTQGVEHQKLPEFYNKFGYFVAPSRTEAQGVAMCEAMACGLPVIATKVGGIPEFVTNNVNGILIPPEKPMKLREAIKQLLLSPTLYNRLSENGIRFMREHLSCSRIYQKEYEIFKGAQEGYDKRN